MAEEKRRWIDPEHRFLSVARQCDLIELPRSTWYHEPAGEAAENLDLMRAIDEQYLLTPFYGSRRMAVTLGVNRKRVQRLMRLMVIEAIYPRPKTTVAAPGHKIHPYLLRNVKVLRPDQAWSTDITFIRQSTIAENSAANGGGIDLENSATATILQSTIVQNSATANGGGLKISSSYVLLHNTLVADNTAATAYPDVDGAVLSASSYNLISDGTGMTGISGGSQGNQVGTAGTPIDAMLGTLGDHGGPVQTVPLRVESPALDAGSDELALTRLGRSSSVVYDMLGRVVQEITTDPDGIGSQLPPVTTYAFDANGNPLAETDPLGSVTVYAYDNLGRKTTETDAEDGVTSSLSRQTNETWYHDVEDADAHQNVRKTYATTYDVAGRVATIGDRSRNRQCRGGGKLAYTEDEGIRRVLAVPGFR